jgi:hypothetical protein
MKAISIFEQSGGCCGGSMSESLVSFLQRKFKGEATVEVVKMNDSSVRVPVPASLLTLMTEHGDACLPAMVVDGIVVAHGKLPNFMEAVSFINGKPANAA